MGTSRTKGFVAVALAALLAVSTAACSDDDKGADADRTTTSADRSASPPDADGGSGAEGPETDGEETGGRALERYADYETVSYEEPSHWVCRPDADDICDGDLDTTVIAADGSTEVETFEPADDPPIDCFYVYPTISRDETRTSDWDASDDEEGYVTLNQAARLASQCRVFAPVYRQNTLTSLTANLGGGNAEVPESDDPPESPYADVLDAFRTYMAEDNGGRGFVLIGHSQGAALLNQLIAEEVDPNEDVREHLVSAYLAGWSVAVPNGQVVGGDFDNVPVCEAADQTGCVISWVSFRSTAPPPSNSFFGKPRAGADDGSDAGYRDRMQAVCANPADLSGGEAPLHSYFPSNREASILSDLGTSTEGAGWLDPSAGEVTTPYVSVPGLVTGTCASTDGYNYLSVVVHPDDGGPRADDIAGDLTPEWGLHLVDVNLVMGDIVDLVGSQAEAYAG